MEQYSGGRSGRHHLDRTNSEAAFVTKTKKVWTSPDSIPARNPERRKEVTNKFSKTDNYYGQAYRQIAVHRGDSLHAAGFKGEGMQIAVIDAGFIMPTR